jgi:16S rRNA (cytosine1402-N4)-methyltransferase
MSEQETREKPSHLPVLYQEIIHAIQPTSPGRYIDGTLGAGGHAWGILELTRPDGVLLGLDIDPQALAIARQRLSIYGDRAIVVQASYTTIAEQAHRLGWGAVQGIVLDLGVSSMQIDTPARGFSFLTDGPLDMRFDPTNPRSAADLVNSLPEKELAEIIWTYGEERHSRRIAQAIVRARPLHTTQELARVVARAAARESGSGRDAARIHPATRTFQALRIAVNQELRGLETVLPQAVETLAPGGRLAVISFHSLEDRIVKQYFQRESQDCICPPEQPICTCSHRAVLKNLTRHPITAAAAEIEQNPRARSAKLRIAEKISTGTRFA